MRNQSHKSWVSIVREAVAAWREREGWSRETVCQEFVDEFAETEAPHAWNIEFSTHRDTFQRQKNNADKIMRWLDDTSKDNNLLGMNFAPVILRRLPADIRLACLNEILQPLGFAARGIDADQSPSATATAHLVKIVREGSEATGALADLIDGATDTEVARADRELADLEEATRSARVGLRSIKTAA